MKAQVAANPRLADVYKTYSEKLDKVRGAKSKEEKINQSRYIAGDFAMAAARMGLDTPEKPVTTSSSKAPSEAVKISNKALVRIKKIIVG
jgi:hypothetical protein